MLKREGSFAGECILDGCFKFAQIAGDLLIGIVTATMHFWMLC
jgi:hypothetical protein